MRKAGFQKGENVLPLPAITKNGKKCCYRGDPGREFQTIAFMDLCGDPVTRKNRSDDRRIMPDLTEQDRKIAIAIIPGRIKLVDLPGDQFNLAFVDVGGWDTHVNQGGAQGYLAGRLGELGRGLAGLADEIGQEDWAKTTVIVVSEFGRTFHENGNKGTDHGHGSVYWVLGGAVKGGRIAGPQVALSQATLNQGRDLPVLTDYRSLIGEVMGRRYGLSPQKLQAIFPGVTPSNLNIV